MDEYFQPLLSRGGCSQHMVMAVIGEERASLFSFGKNDKFQLGIPSPNTQNEGQLVTTPFKVSHVCEICCAENGTYVLLRDGSLWMCGMEKTGWREMIFPEPVKKVSAGLLHGAALTRSGRLFLWGSNTESQLMDAARHEFTTSLHEKTSPDGSPFVHVVCGGNSVYAFTEKKSVVSGGQNMYGQLGVNSKVDHLEWGVVQMPCSIHHMNFKAGIYHAGFLSDDGDTYVFGWNGVGQMGRLEQGVEQVPHKMKFPPEMGRIVQFECGAHFCVVRTVDGEAWGWGHNAYANLGGPHSTRSLVKRIHTPRKVMLIVPFGWTTLLFLDDGVCYSLGYDAANQTCTSSPGDKVSEPTPIKLPKNHRITTFGTLGFPPLMWLAGKACADHKVNIRSLPPVLRLFLRQGFIYGFDTQ